jgi:hypothetical protein
MLVPVALRAGPQLNINDGGLIHLVLAVVLVQTEDLLDISERGGFVLGSAAGKRRVDESGLRSL